MGSKVSSDPVKVKAARKAMANCLIMPYAKNNQDPTPGYPMLWLSVGLTLLFFFYNSFHSMFLPKTNPRASPHRRFADEFSLPYHTSDHRPSPPTSLLVFLIIMKDYRGCAIFHGLLGFQVCNACLITVLSGLLPAISTAG
ncbi:hypothetical protein PoB_007243800 [Plakobranchus ocellatus]|uniref:Uncharacterized protein n=1 Tax=Plakobranchus ocellatus TaxID=259542 RepID=A0AAV4DNM6_9GAST|nr:hypothetical protein PoB_007243800 [Plakobranchus ocellatus]